ncbi:MAG: ATP phosphoribosyltransferase [Planctomycetota bacterium]
MTQQATPIRLALPKGRMEVGVLELLREAGISVATHARGYRPTLSLADVEVKMLKPQNVVEMLSTGSRDVGFAGVDWVTELQADVVELLDTGLDAVQIVAAAPAELLVDGQLPDRPLLVASELERITTNWMARKKLDATFVRTYGATEVFPPEDADVIVDVTATGATLKANGLVILEDVLTSSTRLFASRRAAEDPAKRARLDELVLLLSSVLEARQRMMVEVNVPADKLEAVVAALPCMREPTMAPLHGGVGYAVKAAVRKDELTRVIPEIKRLGGTDIVVTALSQIVP